MALPSLKLLEKYAAHPFPIGYPTEEDITLYEPDDRVHDALRALVSSAGHSLVTCTAAVDDEIAEIIRRKQADPGIVVQASPGGYLDILVIDALDVVTVRPGIGLSVVRHPVIAARARWTADRVHASMEE